MLPAIAMVLIGFTIFTLIIASAYKTFDNQHVIIDKFEYAHHILEKISSPNSPVTEDGSLFKLKNFKTRPGLSEFEGREYINGTEKSHKVFPQDNQTEGFFIAKLRKTE